jgi:hypothetical protein
MRFTGKNFGVTLEYRASGSPPDISRDITDLSYFILSLILYHVMFGDARRFKLPVGYHACTHRIT